MNDPKYYTNIIKNVLENFNIEEKKYIDQTDPVDQVDPMKNVTFNYKNNGDAVIEVLLPGAKKEDLNITVQNINNNDYIVIEAKYNRLKSFKQLQLDEQLYNNIFARIPILIQKSKYNTDEPKTVTYVDGVLTIVLKENIDKVKTPKKITIN